MAVPNHKIHEDLFLDTRTKMRNPVLTLIKLCRVICYFLITLHISVVSAQTVAYPCTNTIAIQWVRDPNRCDIYYICHFGQPSLMPACPRGQIWSNVAHNCVPENSRWSDCPSYLRHLKPKKKYAVHMDTEKTKLNSIKSPVRKSFRYRDPTLIGMYEDRSSFGADQGFWDKLLMAMEKFLEEEEESTSRTPTTVTPSDDKMDHSLWYTSVTTPPRMHLTDKAHHPRLVTSDTHQSDKEWRRRRKYPQYKRLTRQWEEEKRKSSKSHWFSHRHDGVNPDEDEPFGLQDRSKIHDLPEENPCKFHIEGLFPHPRNCHWYFNCSSRVVQVPESLRRLSNLSPKTKTRNYYTDVSELPIYDSKIGLKRNQYRSSVEENFIVMDPTQVVGEELFVWECRYPQLFDEVTSRCREFINVYCRGRFEPYDQCEYSVRQCPRGSTDCIPCENQFGQCRGRENGVFPLQGSNSWSPVFITCYLQRNIAKDECRPPKPVFSPHRLDCVSLLEVPKENGGFQPDCTTRADGYYPDEQGRCAIFFRCALGYFRGYDECPPGSVFDPAQLACETYSEASQPCGMGRTPACSGRTDGLYADPYGRCTHYFRCKAGEFDQYHKCDLGIFDPLTHKCVVAAELTVRPCGLQASPCEALPTGLYPDQATGCDHFIECYDGVLLTNGSCPEGAVFSALTGRCDKPELAPPPCGTSNVCLGRPDGRYPAPDRGCSFYSECQHGQFASLRRCTAETGGYFFNPETGDCDYPQNICPPCGYRWWGCPRTYRH